MKALAKFTAVVLSGFIFQSLQSLSAQTPAMTADQVLAKMEQSSRNYPFLQANIQRTKFTALTRKTSDPQTGKIWIATPENAARRLKIDFDKPLKELFLIDKGEVTHYYPVQKQGDAKKVNKDDQAEGECVLFGLCQPGPRIQQYYDVRVADPETIDGVKTIHLELKPKDPKHPAGITLIDLWLDSSKWYAVQTRVTETNKNYVNARYSNFQTGNIADTVFKLDTRGGDINKR